MTSATSPAPAARAPLPKPIRRALGRLDHRIRALSVARGLGTVLVLLTLGAALGMAADLTWVLPRSVRWGIWGTWVGISGLALLRAVWPLVRRQGSLDLAAAVERGNPELGERLTGAVGLLGAGGPGGGSAELVAAVVGDAVARVQAVDPRRAVSSQRAARRLALGLLLVGLIAAPMAFWPRTYRVVARRFLTPWVDLERIGRFAVTVIPGDRVVALGSDLTVSAVVAPRLSSSRVKAEDAWLEWTETGTTGAPVAHRVAMPPVEADDADSTLTRRFAVTLPRLTGSFRYRVVSGTSESPRYQIEAIEPPSVTALTARVEPPSYTKFPATTARDPSRVEAWEGSRVVLNVRASRGVKSIDVDWPQPEPRRGQDQESVVLAAKEPLHVPVALAPDGASGTAALTAEVSGTYGLSLIDTHGLANKPEPPRRLIVRPDAPPVVAVQGTDALKESRPDDVLALAVAARDDVAVASVELHYTILHSGSDATPGAPAHVAAPLKGIGTQAARGEARLDLAPLKLRPGDSVAYRVRVADNRPAPKGPNVVWSESQSLSIVAAADSLQARRAQAERASLQAQLDELKKAAAENRKEAEQLRYAADAAQRGNGPWDKDRQQALDHREAEARAVADKLQILARALAESVQFRPLARPARQIAEVEAEAGRAMLDQARREEEAARRLADLRQADTRLGAVTHRLDDLQRQFDALAQRDADIEKLATLAAREQDLAARAADAEKAPDRAQLDRLQADQAAVQADLDALLKKSPELRADVLEAQAQEAAEIAKKAHELADRQRDEARRAADLSKQAEALKALAEAQRALEEDARRLALDVNTPLAENGRGQLNTEEIRQAAEPIERGNLDEARRRLEAGEIELRRLARDLEDVPGDARAHAQRLARQQQALNNDTAAALAQIKADPELKPDQKAAKLAPLAERQAELAKGAAELAKSDQIQDDPKKKRELSELAEAAKKATAQAAEALPQGAPHEITERENKAQRALNRLAEAIPTPASRQNETRQQLHEARRHANEVQHALEQALRETAPQPGRPNERGKGAEALARRVAPLAEKQAKVAEALGKLAVAPRAAPQRDRAAHRAQALADLVKQAAAKDAPEALREAIPAAQVDALAGLERLEQKLDMRVPADDLAAELAADQRALQAQRDHPPADAPAHANPRAAEADDQRRIATALRNLPVPDAPVAQAEAVRAAEHAAEALADPNPDHDPKQAVAEARRAADALADRLADRQPAKARAEALARAERALNAPDAPAEPERAAERQKAIAAELARLPIDPKEKQAAAEAVHQAAAVADRARQPRAEPTPPGEGKPTPAAVAEARAQAAEALEKLAAAAPEGEAPAPGDAPGEAPAQAQAQADPDLPIGPQQAAEAGNLARRERQVRERLQAMLAAQAEPQQGLKHESQALGAALADLRDRTRPLNDRAQGPANEAARLLGNEAPQVMDQGAAQLVQGQANPARETQRRAAEVIERGAQQAEDLAAALRADRPNVPAGQAQADADADAAPSPLGEARDAMRQAGQQLEQARDPAQAPAAAPAAAQALQAAADGLRAAVHQASDAQAAAQAQAQGQAQPGEPTPGETAQADPGPGTPEGTTLDPKGTEPGTAAPDLAALKEMIRRKTGRAWGELPGHLRTEILQMSQGRYRDDYARLIQLYFREIAAGAASKTGKPE